MNFRTPVENIVLPLNARYTDKYVLIGSCFTEHIAAQMRSAYMQVCDNPFGILYNPSSIAECVRWLFSDRLFTEKELIYHNGLYHSFLHHGIFSAATPQQTLDNINAKLTEARRFISEKHSDSRVFFIFTFGTAFVYQYEGQVVGNCHKLPQNQFNRTLLTAQQIVSEWESITRLLIQSGVENIIYTVSPIRHLKDGLHSNQISKATLLLAIEQIVSTTRASYFPSYEIMNDELRDYRFFAEDMLHPNEVAVKYIWDKFIKSIFVETELQKIYEAQTIYKMMNHRMLHPETAEAQRFEQMKQQRFINLKQQYPWIENY